MLALVFMNALHLDIEHRLRIDFDSKCLLDVGSKIELAGKLDLTPALTKGGIVGEYFQLS